jgi:hypothetical protein
LVGRKQVRTRGHPAIRALVRQRGIGEAGIGKAEVRLPKTLALDVDNAQALCEFEDGTKPDLENHCPRGSIVGRARAQTPLLNDPLVGNVYFVKNVRIDPDTGNEIRTLPMIVVALRGEIAVNLVGESDVKKGKLVNTFDNIPDAPISQFNMNIRGGKNGILAVTGSRRSTFNLCRMGRQIARLRSVRRPLAVADRLSGPRGAADRVGGSRGPAPLGRPSVLPGPPSFPPRGQGCWLRSGRLLVVYSSFYGYRPGRPETLAPRPMSSPSVEPSSKPRFRGSTGPEP